MIKFFRKIRQKLLTENKFSKYMIYAIGEIVLVVIGILIALQINNWNEDRKERDKEIKYLINIKADLINEKSNTESFEKLRINNAEISVYLLNISLPIYVEQAKVISNKYYELYAWNIFVPNNNTFKELISSGNLSIIKNDSIKNNLLELERLYSDISITELHMRREYEEYFYDETIINTSIFSFSDFSKPSFTPPIMEIEDVPIAKQNIIIEEIQWMHNSVIINNGLKLAIGNNSYLALLHKNASSHIDKLIGQIDKEIIK